MRLLLLLAANISLFAQQTVNGGRTTLGPVDNSGATRTSPMKVGSSVPGTCTVGDLFFNTVATAGQNIYECQSTNVYTQQLNTGSSSGGGISVYSANGLTVTANTYYFPIGGGGTPSTTETNVDIDSPAAATITNFFAQLSVALGMGNSGVFTLRKNAASQSITCTISGASTTACSDTTHSFNVAQGDLLTVQLVTTGTIVVTPNVMFAMQFGNITASGTVNTGTAAQVVYYAANGSAVSGATVTGAVKAGNPPTQAAAADLSDGPGLATKAGVQAGGYVYCADAAGSGTTYTCSVTPTLTAYTTGMLVVFKPGTASSGASTLNIDSVGAKTILNSDGLTAIATSDLLANGVYVLQYNGTNLVILTGPDGPWIGVSYANSWVDNTNGWQVLQYRKLLDGTVQFRGAAKSSSTTAAGTTIINMPAGYRPPATAIINGVDDGGSNSTIHNVVLNVATSGTIQLNYAYLAGTGAVLKMESLSYSTR